MSNTSANSVDTFLRGPHSDEQIPPSVEEPLTWLDDLGLGGGLDAAVERVRAFYKSEYDEDHPSERIRLALLEWLALSVSDLLERAGAGQLNLGAGSRHFYAALERLAAAPADAQPDAAPPPPEHGAATPSAPGTAAF